MTSAPEPRARLFVAVQPEPAAIRDVMRAIEPLRASPDLTELRWNEPEKLHFTLRFLGSQPLSAAGAIEAECAGTAARSAPFNLTLAGGGAFPSPRRASVLWIGATEGAPALCGLAEQLNPRLDALGFEREERAFTPHLTIARSKRPRSLVAPVSALAPLRIETAVRELLLVRSHLGRPSARYEVLERFVLTSAPAAS
jgi:RNA 2',3'-cyclic 3'-phosphodiesterase